MRSAHRPQTIRSVRSREAELSARLADARGREVVFVAHCLLDENARYLGGAFHSGAVPELIELLQRGVGVVQMPCPEQRAWGGLLKPWMLRAYGLRDSRLYPVRGPLFRAFVAYTRLRYLWLARRTARDIEDFRRAGVRVLGVVGVGGSPTCGAGTTFGEGLFSRALERELARRGIDVPFVDYDLAGEMRGMRQDVFKRLRVP